MLKSLKGKKKSVPTLYVSSCWHTLTYIRISSVFSREDSSLYDTKFAPLLFGQLLNSFHNNEQDAVIKVGIGSALYYSSSHKTFRCLSSTPICRPCRQTESAYVLQAAMELTLAIKLTSDLRNSSRRMQSGLFTFILTYAPKHIGPFVVIYNEYLMFPENVYFKRRCLHALTFRHRASSILGKAFHYSPENAFYIFNQQIYFII